jgi:hypothetical protein
VPIYPLMTCSSCGIENVPSAQRCDCGNALSSAARSGPEIMFDTFKVCTDVVCRLIFVFSMGGALYAGFDLWQNWDAQKSAPQQAALAGYVLAWAVIPYCFARSFAGMSGRR